MKFLLGLRHPLLSITKKAVADDAKTDAMKGIYQPDPVIEGYIGPPPPAYDPANNIEHAEIEQERNSVTASELANDVDTAKRAAAREFSPGTTAMISLVFFLFETAAASLLAHIGGLNTVSSVIFGAMFAAVLFKLTELCSRAEASGWRYWLAIVAMTTFVAAVVLVRQDAVTGDGESMAALMKFAWTVIFAGITIGPAWLASRVLRAFFAGRALRVDLRVKKELHKAEAKKVEQARENQQGIQTEHQAWRNTYRVLRAVYDREWSRLDPDPSTPSGLVPVNRKPSQLNVFKKEGINEN